MDSSFPIESRGEWKITFNGFELPVSKDNGEFYSNPYLAAKGHPGQWLAWSLPREIIKNGLNTIDVQLMNGREKSALMWIEVGMPIGNFHIK